MENTPKPITERLLKEYFSLGVVTRAVIEQTRDGKYIFTVISNSTKDLGECKHRLFSVRYAEREFSTVDKVIHLVTRIGMKKNIPIELKLDY